jgi:hypothetical protein
MNPWTDFFDALIAPKGKEDGPMVRMFRTEYPYDYRNAVRNRVNITEEYARSFVNKYHL